MAPTHGGTAAEPRADRPFFPNLDGLRFLAFFSVFLSHGFGGVAARLNESDLFGGAVRRVLFQSAELGVSFFFVLSGFLITYLILHERRTTGRVDVPAFYVRRTLRIWPLYFAVLAYAFLLGPALAAGAGWMRDILRDRESAPLRVLAAGAEFLSYHGAGNPAWYVTFLSNFEVRRLVAAGVGALLTDVTWSIAIEEQFYLTWPLWFRLLPQRAYGAVFPAIAAGSFAFRFVHAPEHGVLYFHTFSVISDMAVGGGAAYLCLNRPGFVAWFAALRAPAVAAAYLAGFAVVLFRQEIFASDTSQAAARLVLAFFFAFVVLEQNYATRWPVKMGRSRALSKLGAITYGLYLLHPVGITLAGRAVLLAGMAPEAMTTLLARGLLGLGLTIGLAAASWRLFERPFLRLKDRWSRTPRAATAPPAPA